MRILGIDFLVGTPREAVDVGLSGGLVTAPSAPLLADLRDRPALRTAIEQSDLVIIDSGFMVLLWRLMGRGRLPRLSGLAYLREMLGRPELREPGACFWVVPSEAALARQRTWLAARGIPCEPAQAYVAPLYETEEVEDPALLARLREARPRQVLIGIGGGRQEQLGLYLRRNLEHRPGIHCTGAAIGFFTGEEARIPAWADRLLLGWAFRLVRGPRGFWRRLVKALRLAPLMLRYGERSPAAGSARVGSTLAEPRKTRSRRPATVRRGDAGRRRAPRIPTMDPMERRAMTGHIPEGASAVNAYVMQSDADAAIRWYVENLGAKETMRLPGPGGQGVMHAEVDFDGTLVMMSDANPEWGTAPPGELSSFTLTLYVPDCDAVFARCIAAGATELDAMADQFWGDRAGKLRDPFGHVWMIMTHKEDVSPEEVKSRFEQVMREMGGGG